MPRRISEDHENFRDIFSSKNKLKKLLQDGKIAHSRKTTVSIPINANGIFPARVSKLNGVFPNDIGTEINEEKLEYKPKWRKITDDWEISQKCEPFPSISPLCE